MKPLDMETVTRAALTTGARDVHARRGEKPRAHTLSMRRDSKREADFQRTITTPLGIAEHQRPTTRGGCLESDRAVRPCPFVSCKHHLYLDVNERNGNIKINFPGLEVWEMSETCALDVADRGGATLDEVGALVNVTNERVQQIVAAVCGQLKGRHHLRVLAGEVEGRSDDGADDGSGARTDSDAIEGLAEIAGRGSYGPADDTDGPTRPGDRW